VGATGPSASIAAEEPHVNRDFETRIGPAWLAGSRTKRALDSSACFWFTPQNTVRHSAQRVHMGLHLLHGRAVTGKGATP